MMNINDKNKIIIISVLILVLAILASTNPDKSDFAVWLLEDSMEESEESSDYGDARDEWVSLGRAIGENYVKNIMERHDYIIFSVYEAKDDVDIEEGKYRKKYVGIFNEFFRAGGLENK